MAIRGRKPKPTAIKKLNGNPGKRALNKNEPKVEVPATVPDPPGILNKVAKKEWNRLAPELHKIGVLTNLDLNVLSFYCKAFARWINAEKRIKETGELVKANNGYPMPNPYLSISNTAQKQMNEAGAKLGLDPSSRSRIEIKKPEEKDPFEEFLKSGGKLKAVK